MVQVTGQIDQCNQKAADTKDEVDIYYYKQDPVPFALNKRRDLFPRKSHSVHKFSIYTVYQSYQIFYY